MGRVHRIHVLRQYVNRTTLKMYGAGVIFGVLMGTVSLTNIYANMPSLATPANFIDFILRAVVNTDALVQVLVVGLMLVSVLALRDIKSNLKEHQALFPQM